MPQNPLEILKKLPLSNLPRPTDEQRVAWDASALESQAADPMWKQIGRGALDAVTGVFTEDPAFDPDFGQGSIGSQIGGLAGLLPFGAAMGGIKKVTNPGMREVLAKFGASPHPPRAAKGLTGGVQGFQLPDGKIARPDAEGVNRILEGNDAMKALQRIKQPIARQNAESGFAPTVSSPEELPDVAVPIADSLDTDMANPPLLGDSERAYQLSSRRNKLSVQDVKEIRQLYETGSPISELSKLYPNVTTPALHAIIKGESWAKVK